MPRVTLLVHRPTGLACRRLQLTHTGCSAPAHPQETFLALPVPRYLARG